MISDEQIKHMVDRFLSWGFPSDMHPDGGLTFDRFANPGTTLEYEFKPTGTNLLDATQASAMVRHMLEGLPASVDLDECPFCGGAALALSPAAQGKAEPVAWRYRFTTFSGNRSIWQYWDGVQPSKIGKLAGLSDFEEQPLYTHPSPSISAGRDEGLEEAAQWHDQQAIEAKALMDTYGPENDIDGMRHRMAGTQMSTHQKSARCLRSAKGSRE